MNRSYEVRTTPRRDPALQIVGINDIRCMDAIDEMEEWASEITWQDFFNESDRWEQRALTLDQLREL